MCSKLASIKPHGDKSRENANVSSQARTAAAPHTASWMLRLIMPVGLAILLCCWTKYAPCGCKPCRHSLCCPCTFLQCMVLSISIWALAASNSSKSGPDMHIGLVLCDIIQVPAWASLELWVTCLQRYLLARWLCSTSATHKNEFHHIVTLTAVLRVIWWDMTWLGGPGYVGLTSWSQTKVVLEKIHTSNTFCGKNSITTKHQTAPRMVQLVHCNYQHHKTESNACATRCIHTLWVQSLVKQHKQSPAASTHFCQAAGHGANHAFW